MISKIWSQLRMTVAWCTYK